jgi:hypothetical protein
VRIDRQGQKGVGEMKKIRLILVVLMSTLVMLVMVGKVNAGEAWVLWKEWSEVQPNGEIEIRWFFQKALPEYSMCYQMALRLAEEDRKTFNAGGKLTVVRIGDKEGEGTIIFYRCFPDTFDPRK